MLSFSLFLSFLFQMWLYESLRLLPPPSVPPSQYLLKHYLDHRPKRTEMDLDEFTKFMKCIEISDIQWVVDWWHISGMVNRSFKDNYVLWLGSVVALTTLHVVLQGNLVTIKELLVMMVPSIPWNLLRGSWAKSVRLSCKGW